METEEKVAQQAGPAGGDTQPATSSDNDAAVATAAAAVTAAADQSPSDAPSITPHPPAGPGPNDAPAAARGRAHRRGASRLPSAFHAAANAASPTAAASATSSAPASDPCATPCAPVAQESLPYHRKRLLELVDPSTYADVIADTAAQLGVDLAQQPHKRWVVEALFLAPLPQGIVRCYDPQGRAYYYNKETRTSTWAHPCAKQFETLLRAQNEPSNSNDASAAAATGANAATSPQRDVPSRKDDQESKCNDSDFDFTASTAAYAAATAATAAPPAAAHSIGFLRSNAGLSSTSSLFLSEEELAHWGGGEEDAPPSVLLHKSRDRQARARGGRGGMQQRRASGHNDGGDNGAAGLHDDEFELGGRDGERWAGEDGEDEPHSFGGEARFDHEGLHWPSHAHVHAHARSYSHAQAQAHPAPPPARRTSARPRSSRPTSSAPSRPGSTVTLPPRPASYFYSAGAAAAGAAQPAWNIAQPLPFHPWINAGGVGETEASVPNPGSLIAPSPSVAAPSSSSRPASGSAHARGVGAAAVSDGQDRLRSDLCSHIRASQQATRARINGSLRSQAAQLFSLRQALHTKARALERIGAGLLARDEHDWREQGAATGAFAAVTEQRLQLFHQAHPSLLHGGGGGDDGGHDGAGARADPDAAADIDSLSSTLLHAASECQGGLGRAQEQLHHLATLRGQLRGLQSDLEEQAQRAGEALRVDAACLELAKNGSTGGAAAAVEGAPAISAPASLVGIHHVLTRAVEFESHLRQWHGTTDSRRAQEKLWLGELARGSSICLRRNFQRASERRATLQAEMLANKAVLPALHSRAHSLQQSLAAQVGPLEVCQRTYQLRRGGGGGGGSGGGHGGDSHGGSLLSGLEDELAALTTLVAHLESESALVSGRVSRVLQRDRALRDELLAEDGRVKLFRAMLAVEPRAHQHHHPQQQSQSHAHPSRLEESATQQDQHGRWHSAASTARPASGMGRSASPALHAHAHAHAAHVSLQRSARPASSRPYDGGGGAAPARPSSSRASVRPVSASSGASFASTAHAIPSVSHSVAAELAHSRNQLVRDHAANLERLRTRKVRRAKVASGAADKRELLIPSAGRPVFEGVHSTGYDS